MKKEPKVEYGIQIVKPWSREMYDHNDAVADRVREDILNMWMDALDAAEAELDEEDGELSELDWECASDEMIAIQKAVTICGYGFGYTIERICDIFEDELEAAPYYRLKEMVEDLDIKLEKGFVGFN
jgi:hypothetical protein